MRLLLILLAFLVGLAWGWLSWLALSGPEPHDTAWWRTVAFLGLFLSGSLAAAARKQ